MLPTQSTAASRPLSQGGFQFHLFIRTVETPLPPPPDPADEVSWKRLTATIVAATLVPLVLAAVAVFVKGLLHSY